MLNAKSIKNVRRGQIISRFKQPQGYWLNVETHRYFFDRLFNQLGYKNMEDWYKVTQGDITKNGGRGLLARYHKNSPSLALLNVYPKHNWLPWKFNIAPKGYPKLLTKDPKEAKRWIEWLGNQLSINYLNEWYRVSLTHIKLNWGYLIGSSRDFYKILSLAYPQHQWNLKMFGSHTTRSKSSQRELMRALQQLFPCNSELLCDMSFSSSFKGWKKTSNIRCYSTLRARKWNWTYTLRISNLL